MSGYRLSTGGRVDRSKTLNFTFDGASYSGFAGDTLASALIASGVTVFGRSFKYHRPRGLLATGVEEPNALVTVDRGAQPGYGRTTPNLRAPQVELYDGLTTKSQNRWPSLKFDMISINDRLGAFFPAGFYNKTFMWPRSAWEKLYEPVIRHLAGLGESPTARDPDHYDATYTHCETLVIGAGIAGIEAALAATGRVILIDEQDELGGGALSDAGQWPALDALKAQLAASGVTVLTRTTAFGYYHQNFVGAVQHLTDHLAPAAANGPREKLWRIRAGEVVLAQGAIERPLVFNGNDVPGVMLASAGRMLALRYGVSVGRSIVVMAAHDSGWHDALAMAAVGVPIAAIIDIRNDIAPDLVAAARAAGIATHLGHAITSVKGRLAVTGITYAMAGTGPTQSLACDAVLMAGGWTPSVHLWSHAKGALVWNDAWGAYLPGKAIENCRAVGAGAGEWSLGNGVITSILPNAKPVHAQKAFVDFQNDVKARDINLAVQEGMRSIEHIKRYTTNGMATDQGKTSNLNGLQLASSALGRPVTEIGLTTFRPPYTPQTFGALMGHHKDALFQPVRKSPIDDWARDQGAVFENVANWRRARYFPQGTPNGLESMDAAVLRECAAVRNAVGMFDASTLGKIEVVGPDAAEFLNRMYTNPWKALQPGRCRYGLLLREDGFIVDDGVSARLADDRFHLTTTTGGAARVLGMMEDYLQTEWSDLNVWLTSTTEQWAVIALQGPRAREVIAGLVQGIDLSPEAFPHMAIREGTIAGVPTRLFRVSFTGELGFEINVPAHEGRKVWEAIHAAGQAHGIVPYGTEAMHVLRAEKGFIIVGQDTDGTMTPYDMGLDWAVGKKKPDFVGKRSLARPEMTRPGRKQFIGLLTEDPQDLLEEGAQIVTDPTAPVPVPMIGHVTSSYRSAPLGRTIALAVIADGRDRIGQTVHIPMPGRTIRAKVTEPMFYDAEGSRLNA